MYVHKSVDQFAAYCSMYVSMSINVMQMISKYQCYDHSDNLFLSISHFTYCIMIPNYKTGVASN